MNAFIILLIQVICMVFDILINSISIYWQGIKQTTKRKQKFIAIFYFQNLLVNHIDSIFYWIGFNFYINNEKISILHIAINIDTNYL